MAVLSMLCTDTAMPSVRRRNVIEFPWRAWESPPGLAICPLDVVFMICAAAHSWLSCNDGHIAVRH